MKKRAACAVSAALAATLLLGACGGGGDGGSDDIEGAERNAKHSAPASPTPAPTTEPGAPEFDFPKDVTVEIEPQAAGGKAKDAVLRDHGYALRAINLAAAEQDPELPLLQKYLTGQAASGWASGVREYKKRGKTVTGTVRYYQRTVKVTDESTAGVTYCEDQRHFYDKDAKTQKVEKTTPSAKSFVYHVSFMRKNGDGTWQMERDQATRGAGSCAR